MVGTRAPPVVGPEDRLRSSRGRACGFAKALAGLAHALVERMAVIVIAVHRRLHHFDDLVFVDPWLGHDEPGKPQMLPCHFKRPALSMGSSLYLPDAERRGVQPSRSHNSAPSPKRNVEDATLPPMCCRHNRDWSRAFDTASLGAIPTYSNANGSDGCGRAGMQGMALGTPTMGSFEEACQRHVVPSA